jgi:hypothetical protein
MRNLLLATSFLLVTSGLVFGQQSETRAVGSFSGIKVMEGIDVRLAKGDKESVRVEVDGMSLNDVITEVSGSYLRIHMSSNNSRNRGSAKVFVTYVRVDKLSASSAGNIFSDNPVTADDMELSASSAGSIEITVHAGNVEASASSAGQIELQGKADKLNVTVASAGQIDAYDLSAQRVKAEAVSAGSIKLSVSEDLVAHASSGGSIRYHGNPTKSNTNSTSGGSVKKSN